MIALLPAVWMAGLLNAGINLDSGRDIYFADKKLISPSLKPPQKLGFGASTTFGYLATHSTVGTASLNAEVKLGYNTPAWRQRLELQAISAGTDGQTTAEQYYVAGQSDYRLGKQGYVFGFGGYLHDRFSGYRYQASAVVGYGMRWFATKTQLLETELGFGAAQARTVTNPTQIAESKSSLVVRARLRYNWNFSNGGVFTQSVTIERTRFNTYTKSISKVTTQLFGNVAFAIGYTIQRNSNVSPGVPNTTSYTSIAVQYTFGPIFSRE